MKLGSIVIDLVANTQSFSSAMTKMEQLSFKTSASVGRSFALIGAAAASMGVAVEGAFATMVVKSENLVFAYNKMSQTAGVSIQDFSKLAFIARTAGVPVEQMGIILTRVSKSAFAAGNGNAKMAATYKELGVSVVDSNGHFRDAGAIYQDLAVSLNGYKDGASKVALEQALMGRSGAQTASMMRLMATQGTELGKMAEKLGVIFTPEQAAGAITLHNALTNLEQAGLGFAVRLSTAVVPALDKAAQKLLALASNAETLNKIQSISSALATGLTMLANAFVFVVEHAKGLTTALSLLVGVRAVVFLTTLSMSAIGATGAFTKVAVAVGNMSGALLGMPRLGAMFASALPDMLSYVKGIWSYVAAGDVASATTTVWSSTLEALRTTMASVVITISALTAGIAIFTMALFDNKATAEKMNGATTWGDMWTGAINNAKESLKDFALIMQAIITKDFSKLGQIKWTSLPAAAAQAASNRTGLQRTDNVAPPKTVAELKDLGAIPGETKEDKIAKRLAELRIKAKEASDALAAVGNDPQQLRNAESQKQSDLFNVDNPKATEQQKVMARALSWIEINKKAATEYALDIDKQTRGVDLATEAQLAMTSAMGMSAEAVKKATVDAQVADRFKKYGPNWRTDYPDDVAAATQQFGKQFDVDQMQRAKAGADATILQFNAQELLNNAILQGTQATEAAELANIRASIESEQRTNTDKANVEERVKAAQALYGQSKNAGDLNKAASMSPSLQFENQKQSILDIADAAEKSGHALDYRMILEANKANMMAFNSAMDKATLSTGTAMEGLQLFFRQMTRDVESGAQQMYTVLNGVFSSLNDSLSALMMGQKGGFDQFFRGIASQLSKLALSKIEMGIVNGVGSIGSKQGEGGWGSKLLGFGKDAKAVKGDSIGTPGYMYVVNMPGATSSLTSSLTDAASPKSSGMGGFFSSLLGMIPGVGGIASSLHLPGFALGGAVQGGAPITVGEMGSETFVPNQNGTIIPHNKAGGNVYYSIDARGTDPAESNANFARALVAVHGQAVQDAGAAQREAMARRPRGSF